MHIVLLIIAVLTITQTAVAGQIVSFDAELRSEKTVWPTQTNCAYHTVRPTFFIERQNGQQVIVPVPGQKITELEDCGVSMEAAEPLSYMRVGTAYGLTSFQYHARRDRGGAYFGIGMKSVGGTISANVDAVVVERPRTIEALQVNVGASPDFDIGRFRILDHNTDELIWEYDNSVRELRRRRFDLEFEGEDQFNRAFRFEYEADGSLSRGGASFVAIARFQIPEPSSSSLTMVGLFPLALLRKRGRRSVWQLRPDIRRKVGHA